MIFFERSLEFPTDVRWFWRGVWVNTNFKYWLYRRGNLLHVKRLQPSPSSVRRFSRWRQPRPTPIPLLATCPHAPSKWPHTVTCRHIPSGIPFHE